MSSNPCVGRPLNSRSRMRMAVWSQVKVCGCSLSLQPVCCMPALPVTPKCRCSCGMRLVAVYKCYMPMPLPIYHRFVTSSAVSVLCQLPGGHDDIPVERAEVSREIFSQCRIPCDRSYCSGDRSKHQATSAEDFWSRSHVVARQGRRFKVCVLWTFAP